METLYDASTGVSIVSKEDVHGGRPVIEDTRLTVYSIVNGVDISGRVQAALDGQTLIDRTANQWEHIGRDAVTAAFEFAREHPDHIASMERLKEDENRLHGLHRAKCKCGHEGPVPLPNHLEEGRDYGEDDDHGILHTYFHPDLHIRCACGEVFDDDNQFTAHYLDENEWPLEFPPAHRLEAVLTDREHDE